MTFAWDTGAFGAGALDTGVRGVRQGQQATPVLDRQRRGRLAYLSGVCAEEQVAAQYAALGARVLETRWRGRVGEIDLILTDDEVIVFVEVKKSHTVEAAMARLGPAQMQRIHGTASEYLEFVPNGQLSEVRFDLALVDATGQIKIMQDAFGHF